MEIADLHLGSFDDTYITTMWCNFKAHYEATYESSLEYSNGESIYLWRDQLLKSFNGRLQLLGAELTIRFDSIEDRFEFLLTFG